MKEKIKKDSLEIATVKAVLCDEKSVHTFENLLNYRMTNERALLRECFEEGHNQYFPVGEILYPSDREIFVDAGAYNGGTAVEFAEWVRGKYKKIYSMEPDALMYNIAKEYIRLQDVQNIELFQKGAYSTNGTLKFTNIASSGSSHIDEGGISSVDTIKIDSLLRGEAATYIKMDIEGVELEALIGAKETIQKYKPDLAICIYHKDDDLWKLPYYIHKNYPFYKLYMRHYVPYTTNETVLYATVR